MWFDLTSIREHLALQSILFDTIPARPAMGPFSLREKPVLSLSKGTG